MNLPALSLPATACIVLVALATHGAATESLTPSPTEIAQHAGPAQGRGPQGGPPPREAFEACAAKAENEACGFSTRDGKRMEGACKLPPRGPRDQSVCVPSDHKNGRG